jgi:hypothetical protein
MNNLDEQFKKIGNQIGGSTSAQTPTPVGRAGSLPGSAQAGSPNSYLAELSYLDEIVDKAYERANQWIPRMSEGAQRATDVAVKEIIKRACQDWGQFRCTKSRVDVEIWRNSFDAALNQRDVIANALTQESNELRTVLQQIAGEHPVHDRAAAAFYRVRRKAQEALKP